MEAEEILDQIKNSNWKSPFDWVMKDTKLFLEFCHLSQEVRRKTFPLLSDRFHLKLKPQAGIGNLFTELTQEEWLHVFKALEITNAHTEHKWALIQYRASHGELPALFFNPSKAVLDPTLSDAQIMEFILAGAGPLTRSITALFASPMGIERKWSILTQLTESNAPPKIIQSLKKIKETFELHQKVSAPEIRRVLDSMIEERKKDIEHFPNKYLPILVQDIQKISLLYIRVKRGGLKPKKDKSNRPLLFQEIYEGRELFKKMITFFEIEFDELDEFPFLEKVLRLLHLNEELYHQSNWPNLDEAY